MKFRHFGETYKRLSGAVETLGGIKEWACKHGRAMTRLGYLTLSMWLLQTVSAAEKPAHIQASMHRLHLQSLRIQRLEEPEFDPVDASFSTALASDPSSASASAPPTTPRLKGLARAAARFRLGKHRTRRRPA